MRLQVVIFLTIFLVFTHQTVDAQKVLLLQKPGKTKRFLYQTGDKIAVRMGEPEFTVSGEITYIEDSICIVNRNYTFQLSKVKEVRITRHFLNSSWRMMFLVPVVYTGISALNRGINNEKPIFDNTIPIAAGSFFALGTTSYLLRYRHCNMEDGWKLKVLDYDVFKEKKEGEE